MALDREDIGGWVAKLQRISDRFREVEKRVSDPAVAADQEAFASLMIISVIPITPPDWPLFL